MVQKRPIDNVFALRIEQVGARLNHQADIGNTLFKTIKTSRLPRLRHN
ncbi:hypothetical protein TH47_00840 [Thalassospira sp. MCCC 1A02803]|nr:hypothetical protein TH47_00840 [Thalassospira sp. MCCC 1A02803]